MKICERCKKEFEPYRQDHNLCRICYAKVNNLKICTDCGRMFSGGEGYIYCQECGRNRYKNGTLPK